MYSAAALGNLGLLLHHCGRSPRLTPCCCDAIDVEDDHWPADMSSLACLTDLCVYLREGSGGVSLTGVATLTT